MSAITFQETREDGWATWSALAAMGCTAAAMFVWHSTVGPAGSMPDVAAMNAQDCAACHAGETVLASATLGHAELGLDLVLTPGATAVHATQDCASCHTQR